MDWQIGSEGAPQGQGRIRKESNTCPGGNFEVAGSNSVGASSSSYLAGAANMNETVNGFSPDVAAAYLQNPNRSADSEDAGAKWENQEGGAAAVRKQQKSNNVSEHAQVTARLHQIRDYIGQTSSVMERLQAGGTPQHMELWLRLSAMLDGLKDSEVKLTAIESRFIMLEALNEIVEQHTNKANGEEDEEEDDDDNDNSEKKANGTEVGYVPKTSDLMTRRNELKMKVEESQKKLLVLKEEEAMLVLRQKAQEQLKEFRTAQDAVLASQELRAADDMNSIEERLQCLNHLFEARNELGLTDPSMAGEELQLQNKLAELQTKKLQINQMASQINALSSIPTFSATDIEVGASGDATREEKMAELAMLKDKLARLQSALRNVPSPLTASSSSQALCTNNPCNSSQENLDGEVDDKEALLHLRFKQDNRAQAVSQNHQQQGVVAMVTPPSGLLASTSADNCSQSPTNLTVQQQQQQLQQQLLQQQLYPKDLKLQEAKAKLRHLEELLELIEEYRGAGKPVPEKLLHILSSPTGPLSYDDDNLDFRSTDELVCARPQAQSTPSSTSSSLLSLVQMNSCGSVNAASIQATNRSDISLQNLYHTVNGMTAEQVQKLHRRQQNQNAASVSAKQIKNNVTKLCAATQELEEWMKKDDLMSCINTDNQSQQLGSYLGAYGYQDGRTTSATWGGSPDYSSDDGGASENENLQESSNFIKAPCTNTAAGSTGTIGGTSGNLPGTTPSLGQLSNTVCKESLPSGFCQPRFASLSREMLDSASNMAAGSCVTTQMCSTCLQTPRKHVWRKHSTGSGSSLPTPSAGTNSRGATRGSWTPPFCYCCYNRRHENVTPSVCNNVAPGPPEEPQVRVPNGHQVDNTNWIVQQIAQLQSQLQHMCQTINDKYSPGLVMPVPQATHGPCHPPTSLSPPPLISATNLGTGSSYNYITPQQQNLMLNQLNQCCQLIWHQHYELASLKDSFHSLQQTLCQSHLRVNVGAAAASSSYGHNEESNVNSVTDQLSARSNMDRSQLPPQPRSHLPNQLSPAPAPAPAQQPAPMISVPVAPPPTHYFYPPYGNNLNFQPFQNSNPVPTFMTSPTGGALNNQVPPGNRANNYWDNFRSYSRQNLLSVRSKCNEGRGSSVEANGAGGGRQARDAQATGAAAAGNTLGAMFGAGNAHQHTQLPQTHVPHIPHQQQASSLDDVMTHNLPNHKEKLNASYQSQASSAGGSGGGIAGACVNNIRLQAPAPSAAAEQELQLRQQAVAGASASSASHKSPNANATATLFKCNPAKGGACKKTCRPKDSQQQRGSDPNINLSSSSSCTNINNNINNRMVWNCESGIRPAEGSVACVVEQNLANNRPSQPLPVDAAVNEDLPRNSNCKRSLLMNAPATPSLVVTANTNKCKSSSPRIPESRDPTEESMYSEVAALISVNEQRPSYLMQLFKDLKLITSDSDRQTALLTIHNLASRCNASTASGLQHPDERLAQNDSDGQKPLALCAAYGLATADSQRHEEMDNGEQSLLQRRQPRNVPLRCPNETYSLSSALPVNCRKLAWEVQSILVDMLPYLKLHMSETCSQSMLESIRNLVLQLVPSPQNSPGQLDALLEDALFKFQGCRLRDICDELVTVIAEVLISELTFLRLTTSVNCTTPAMNGGSDFCVVEDDEEEEDGLAEEEGAVGGVDKSHHKVSDCQVAEQMIRCSKSDTVVLDAELAEADQSSRLATAPVVAGGLLMTSPNSVAVEEESLDESHLPEDHSRDYGCAMSSGDVLLNNGLGEMATCDGNAHKKNNTGNSSTAGSASSVCDADVWAVEQDRELLLDHVPTRLSTNSATNMMPSGGSHSNHNTDSAYDMVPTIGPSNGSSSDSHTMAAV